MSKLLLLILTLLVSIPQRTLAQDSLTSQTCANDFHTFIRHPLFKEFQEKVSLDLELLQQLNLTACAVKTAEELRLFNQAANHFLSSTSISTRADLSTEAKNIFPPLHPLFVQVLLGHLAKFEGFPNQAGRGIYARYLDQSDALFLKVSFEQNPVLSNALMLLALNSRASSIRLGLNPPQTYPLLEVFASVYKVLHKLELNKARPSRSELFEAETKLRHYWFEIDRWAEDPAYKEKKEALWAQYEEELRKPERVSPMNERANYLRVEKGLAEARQHYQQQKKEEYQKYFQIVAAERYPQAPEMIMPQLWALKQITEVLPLFLKLHPELSRSTMDERQQMMVNLREFIPKFDEGN